MSYRIISADCHIDMTWMPGDLWVKNAPARFHDQIPQVRETPEGPRCYAEDKELGVFGGLGFGFDRVQRSFSKHVERMFQAGFYERGPRPTTPDLRLKDQGYSTYQHEPSVVPMIPLIGGDTIMWGSDYPHPDGIWPDSQHWIARDLAGASPAVQRKILCENAGTLYGLM
jgi:amidohydrolase family protein